MIPASLHTFQQSSRLKTKNCNQNHHGVDIAHSRALPNSMTSPAKSAALPIPRRGFLKTASTLTVAATVVPFTHATEISSQQRYRAAIIGHTGRGNYGHDMDLIFTDHPKVELVAV